MSIESEVKLTGYEDEITKYAIQKFERLRGDRSNWESHWQDIVELFMPDKDTIFHKTKGERRFRQVYDSAQMFAAELLGSALHSRLTNPAVQWFGFSVGDKTIDALPEVRNYLEEIAEITFNYLNGSNFQPQVSEMYLDFVTLCTSVMSVEEDDEEIIRFKATPIWDHYVDEDYRGLVDTVMTEYEDKTFRQILQEFGEEPFMQNEETKYKLIQLKRNPDQKVRVLHAIFPRTDLDKSKKNAKNLPFVSLEILLEGNIKLKESGYHENPFIVSRFSVTSGEKMGRGPGTRALADARMLQEMAKVVIRVGQKVADPPLMAPDDGAYLPVSTVPNGINYYRAGTTDRIEYLESRANSNISLQMMERVERKIDQAFYVDQLKLSNSGPAKTATEIDARIRLEDSVLSPVLSRQQYEFLAPLIARVYGILSRKGLYPDLPEILKKKDLTVQYSSELATAQKRSLINRLNDMYGVLAPLVELDETARDIVDAQATASYAAEILDLPSKILRSKKQLDEMKAERAQQAQAAQQQEAALNQSQVAKNLQGPAQAVLENGQGEDLIDG